MELGRTWIRDFKGISVTLDPASANVFFGPNDAGKSNILEALRTAFGRRASWRSDPLRDDDLSSAMGCDFMIRLDDAALSSLFARHGDRGVSGRPMMLLNEPGAMRGRIELDFQPLEGVLDQLGEKLVAMIEEYLEYLEPEGLAESIQEFADAGLFEECVAAFDTLVKRRLTSRWFLCNQQEIWWLPPPPDEWTDDDVEAARLLVDTVPTEMWTSAPPEAVEDFARTVASGRRQWPPVDPPYPTDAFWMLWEWDEDEPFGLTSLVDFEADRTDVDQLASSVADRILAIALGLNSLSGVVVHELPPDRWLERSEDGWVRVAPAVSRVCESVAGLATKIAPSFVTADSTIVIEAVSPDLWSATGGRRLRLGLRRRADDEVFDLGVSGKGVAIWAGFAIEEAVRRKFSELEVLQELEGRMQEDPPPEPLAGGESDGSGIVGSPAGFEPLRLIVIDEPERHLHPNAQREAASWLVREALQQTTIFLASHALSFLNLPHEDVRYLRVARQDGITIADVIDDDVLGQLGHQAAEAGITPAELVLLARAFLVVEGKHDEDVLRLYFGNELAARRIEMLPLRGTDNYKALVDLEFLDRQGIPIAILLDNVSRDVARGIISASALMKKEERVCIDLRLTGKDFVFASFEEPDIICAFPDQVVQATLDRHWPGIHFPGWEALKQAWAKAPPENFKDYAVRQTGLVDAEPASRVIGALVQRLRHTAAEDFPGLGPRNSLSRSFSELLANLERRTASEPTL